MFDSRPSSYFTSCSRSSVAIGRNLVQIVAWQRDLVRGDLLHICRCRQYFKRSTGYVSGRLWTLRDFALQNSNWESFTDKGKLRASSLQSHKLNRNVSERSPDTKLAEVIYELGALLCESGHRLKEELANRCWHSQQELQVKQDVMLKARNELQRAVTDVACLVCDDGELACCRWLVRGSPAASRCAQEPQACGVFAFVPLPRCFHLCRTIFLLLRFRQAASNGCGKLVRREPELAERCSTPQGGRFCLQLQICTTLCEFQVFRRWGPRSARSGHKLLRHLVRMSMHVIAM